MKKEKLLDELALIAFKLSDKYDKAMEKTAKMQRLAMLARQKETDSAEFKRLNNELKLDNTVFSVEDEAVAIHKIAKQLKRFYDV